jgi:hypothetical protein
MATAAPVATAEIGVTEAVATETVIVAATNTANNFV